MMTKQDYLQWREHPVTQQFYQDMLEVIDTELASLSITAGENPLTDRKRVGAIAGVQWLLDWQPEFIEEGEQDDEFESTRSLSAGEA